jgi:hypothetical protein
VLAGFGEESVLHACSPASGCDACNDIGTDMAELVELLQ